MSRIIEKILRFDGKRNSEILRGMIASVIEHDTGIKAKIEDDAFNEIKIDGYTLNVWTIENEFEVFVEQR